MQSNLPSFLHHPQLPIFNTSEIPLSSSSKTLIHFLNFISSSFGEKSLNMDGGVGSNVKAKEISGRVRFSEGLLRFMGLLLTLVASILTALDKETKTISVSISTTLPTLRVPVTAKWHYMSAFVYFLVSNAIAFSYAASSLVASMAVQTSKGKMELVLVILDITVMGLLFSANGAAIAIGILGQDGNSHVQWKKVCNYFGGFCHQVTAAIIFSLFGSLVFFWLVALAILNLHKKSR